MMAHIRKLHIIEAYEQIFKFARITGVLGHRQTSKSTFVEANSNEYFTFDDKNTFLQDKKDVVGFVKN